MDEGLLNLSDLVEGDQPDACRVDRGLLIALSVLPLTVALRFRARTVAGIAGATLFVVGGLVPLLPQTSLPMYLRMASLWEIFGQNFLTGAACAVLFAPYSRKLARTPASDERA